MQTIQRTADLLRTAIGARQWGSVEMLLAEFRATVETAWRQLEDDDQRALFQAEVLATFQWARAMTLTSKAQARQKLVHINRHAAYLRSPRERNVIQIDA